MAKSYIHPKAGKRCEECPLFQRGIPVHDEMPPEDGTWEGLAIIGEMPGKHEVQSKHVFVGMSGKFMRTIQEKLKRGPAFVTNCIRCGLPGGNKTTNSEMLLAAQCCRSTVLNNLRWLEVNSVICFGAWPMYHYMGVGDFNTKDGCRGIDTFRGTVLPPTRREPWVVTCTLHPAGIFGWGGPDRYPLVEIFRDDLDKAYRLASGEVRVFEPDVRDAGDVKGLIKWLERTVAKAARTQNPVAVDVEADGKDALTCNLRTIGLSFGGVGYSIPYRGWYKKFYRKNEWLRIKRLILKLLTNPKIATVYQNKQYDVVMLERVLKCVIEGVRHDTMLMHHACYPKTRHDLQSIASQYLAVEPWKAAFKLSKGWDQEEDVEEFANLLWYNAQDAICTEALYHELLREATRMGVVQVVDHDRRKGDFSIDLYRTGIRVDLDFVDRMEQQYREEIAEVLTEMQELVADATGDAGILGLESFFGTDPLSLKRKRGFNPKSPKQLTKFLFEVLGLMPSKLTQKLLTPSTAKDALWEMRKQSPYFELHFKFKEMSQVHSLYLKDVATKRTTEGKPYLYPDGRIHPVWKGHGTSSGRYSTAPMVQNHTRDMLEMFVPRDGCVMIGADYSAGELRLVGALAGQMDLVERFNNDEDIHAFHAEEMYYPEAWAKAVAAGDKQLLKKLRDNSKRPTFGKNYRAGWETIYEQIREDRPDENPQDLMREIRIMSDAYDRRYKDIVRMAETYHEFANENYYLKTAIIGRMRKWPLGKAKPTDCANHPIQGTMADVIDQGVFRYWDSLLKDDRYLNGVWPILQIHDSLFVEVREEWAEEERQRLEDCLSCELDLVNPVTGKSVRIKMPAEAKVGKSVKEVK